MKLHICCNQLKHQWEVRNQNEEVIFSGTLKEVQEYMKKKGL